ncbi:hypothetical protein HDU83_009800, partial [Entophlyctis luteolus]
MSALFADTTPIKGLVHTKILDETAEDPFSIYNSMELAVSWMFDSDQSQLFTPTAAVTQSHDSSYLPVLAKADNQLMGQIALLV